MPFFPGDTVEGKKTAYTVCEQISDNGFATSYRAQATNGEQVFLKQYKDPSAHFTPWFWNYVSYQEDIIKRLSPAFTAQLVVEVREHFVFKEQYFQVHEWVEGRDLRDLIGQALDLDTKLRLARKFLFGLAAVHRLNIVHSDLKPENLRLQKARTTDGREVDHLKITDFDWAIDCTKSGWPWGSRPRGTPFYWSLEHCQGEHVVFASDVQTAGIILYELFCGEHPLNRALGNRDYDQDELLERSRELLQGRRFGHPCTLVATLPRYIGDAIWQALHPDPNERPTAEEFHKAIMPQGATARRLVLVGPSGLRYRFDARATDGAWVPLAQALVLFRGECRFSENPAEVKAGDDGWTIARVSSPVQTRITVNGTELTAPWRLEAGDVLELSTGGSSPCSLKLKVEYE